MLTDQSSKCKDFNWVKPNVGSAAVLVNVGQMCSLSFKYGMMLCILVVEERLFHVFIEDQSYYIRCQAYIVLIAWLLCVNVCFL